jgi:hypothetical protein
VPLSQAAKRRALACQVSYGRAQPFAQPDPLRRPAEFGVSPLSHCGLSCVPACRRTPSAPAHLHGEPSASTAHGLRQARGPCVQLGAGRLSWLRSLHNHNNKIRSKSVTISEHRQTHKTTMNVASADSSRQAKVDYCVTRSDLSDVAHGHFAIRLRHKHQPKTPPWLPGTPLLPTQDLQQQRLPPRLCCDRALQGY